MSMKIEKENLGTLFFTEFFVIILTNSGRFYSFLLSFITTGGIF
ncbi:MAG: hypothetical protein N2516_01850 [Dictyoglomaceae bacterium]|nr:hypothetical protein [Dictyoglomaceae bacterium]